MKAEDACDAVSFMFEAPNQERIADFELKLMDIDAEQLGIPDTDYAAKCVECVMCFFTCIVNLLSR